MEKGKQQERGWSDRWFPAHNHSQDVEWTIYTKFSLRSVGLLDVEREGLWDLYEEYQYESTETKREGNKHITITKMNENEIKVKNWTCLYTARS
jgi:acyl-CoA-binding protein